MKLFQRHRKAILIVLLVVILLSYILGLLLPSTRHQTVSAETAESFSVSDYYATDTGTERVLCIDDSSDALLWRLRVIESAQSELIFSTFDLRADSAGCDIMSALYAAAERGVKVYMVLDGANSRLYLNGSSEFQTLAAHPNVEVKIYNPLNLLTPWKSSFRLHDKYIIADNLVYLLGGRNTNDLFLGDYSDTGNIDRDLLVYETTDSDDSSLAELQEYFHTVWTQECCNEFSGKVSEESAAFFASHYGELQTDYPDAFSETDYLSATIPTNRITLLSGDVSPSAKEPEMWYELAQLMSGKEDVIIQTPYIICNDDMYSGLTEVCSTTGEVKIITNAVESGANPWGCADYLNEWDSISATGVTLCECLGEHSIHTKTILIDNNISVVGSYNLDMRSTYLDTELMLVVDSEELNAQLRQSANENIECSRIITSADSEVTYGSNYTPATFPWWKRMIYTLLRVLTRPFRYML